MVTSATDIGNLALDLLSGGIVQNIVTPTTATESLLNRWYDVCRQKALREHPWHFATKRAVLASSATAPSFGYTKQFPLPSDFLRLLTVESDENLIIPASEYQLEAGHILYNAEGSSLKMRYIYDVTDVNAFDPIFVTFLSYELALAVAYKVTESNTNVQRVGELQKMHANLAKTISGQERPPTRVQRSSSITARRNAGSTLSHRIIF